MFDLLLILIFDCQAFSDQIREDIQEISEHISLNDTVETEQNISKTIENDENRIHEILTSEEDVKEQEEQSVEDVTISPVSMIRHSFSLGDKFRQTL
jgi:hypothetical protein